MKLVTTMAALELLGPDFRWKTDAFLDGPLVDGVLRGNLVLEGRGDPKITLEQWQAFIATLRANGLAAVDGDLVLDRSFFAPVAHDPAQFDGEPQKPYNVGPDALLVNFKSVKFGFAPNASRRRGRRQGRTRARARCRRPAAPDRRRRCGDWQAALGAAFVDRGTRAGACSPGRYPASCGEREWWVSLLDHPVYVHGMFDTYFRAAGGRFDGGWKSGKAPADARPFATLESPPLWDIVRDVNKLSNNVMARQVFLTLATADARPPRPPRALPQPCGAGSRGASSACRSSFWRTAPASRGASGSVPEASRGCCSPPTRAPSARSSPARSRSPRWMGRCNAGSRTAASPDQALLKTGTLDGVRALAGYVIDGEGRRFVVTVLVNHAHSAAAQGPWISWCNGSIATPPRGRSRRGDRGGAGRYIPGTGLSSLNTRYPRSTR